LRWWWTVSRSVAQWSALTLLGQEATQEHPVVIVIDELPYLVHSHPPIEGTLQLTSYDRPLYGRVQERMVEPLSPAEMGEMLDLGATDALNAEADSTSRDSTSSSDLTTSSTPFADQSARRHAPNRSKSPASTRSSRPVR
jgi:hypothetical protein